VQAVLPADFTVGTHSLTLYAAGQVAVSPYNVEAACADGYFGYENETCAACPIGARCIGFNESVPLSNPSMRYPYPVALPGAAEARVLR
jgi:hypothetical protein